MWSIPAVSSDDAKEESIQNILEMAEYRKTRTMQGPDRDRLSGPALHVRRSSMRSQRWMPFWVPTAYDETDPRLLGQALAEKRKIRCFSEPLEGFASEKGKRACLTTGGHYAYLKIAEGCDKHCTYCIIPKVRGNYRSVPMERLLAGGGDAGRPGCEGADPGSTGDHSLRHGSLRRRRAFRKLLKELCKIKGIRWIRILYCYPEEIYR